MTAAPARAYGLALLAGLAPALLLASSCVALRFRFAPELGTPTREMLGASAARSRARRQEMQARGRPPTSAGGHRITPTSWI